MLVHGSCFGIGPLNTSVVRGDVEELLDKLNPVVKRIDDQLRYEILKEGLLCPTCGQPLEAGTLFCPNDGTPIGRPCTSCEYRNKPRDEYCIKCRTAL
ncbi:MAG: double zinc ribbon domain-containing protein [Candidatus Promineifilaceae bacterium]